MSSIVCKTGDSIDWDAVYEIGGVPQDLTLIDIICHAKKFGTDNIYQFVITKSDQITDRGSYKISYSHTLTGQMIPGRYLVDIQYTQDGLVKSSDTFDLIIEMDISR